MASSKMAEQDVRDFGEQIGFGIAYWATEADWSNNTNPKAFCGFREEETGKDYFLTVTDVRKAIRALAKPDQQYVGKWVHEYFVSAFRDGDENGIDWGYLDSVCGDVVAQVAAFGEIVYG